MRILVISLLRLGDFIQAVPLINGLRQKPGASVDVLSYKPTARMAAMASSVDHWWTLDRDEIQEGLGRADIPTLTSLHVLKETLDQISEENYDLVINVTHTRMSGYMMGYIKAKAKLGLVIDERERAFFHSAWFRYLDQHARNPVEDVLNYSDVFLQACGVKEADWSLDETARGREELATLPLRPGPLTVCQVFTSDAKKNWGLNEWGLCLEAYQRLAQEQQIVLIGAPGEREVLRVLSEGLVKRGVSNVTAILSLEGALSLLRRADLLITGDTSIKHLANAGRARIVELSLGSSDYRRTGVYKSDSLILSSAVPCAPCSHEAKCSQSSHLCGLALIPEAVARASYHFLQGEWSLVSETAKGARFNAYRTRRLSTGFWLASDLNDEAAVLRAMLNRSTWKFLIDREHRLPLSSLGTEGVRLHEELRELVPGCKSSLKNLDFLERQLDGVEETVQKQLNAIPGTLEKGPIVDLQDARKRQMQLRERSETAEIQRKLIRSLKSQLMENS